MNQMANGKLFYPLSFLIGFLFFVISFLTLPHYGTNWDTINHLPRGQIFLRYFLFGEKDFSKLPNFKRYYQEPEILNISSNLPKEMGRVSIYQSKGVDLNFFLNEQPGHPPLSDIMSAFFNFILFEKLGLVNDIDSYRVYGVLLASLLVGFSFWWVGKNFGLVPGLVSAISLASYPLFWAESHFNTEKDIPETVYWSFFLFLVFWGVTKRKILPLLVSGIFFGLALGTKFNILFSIFVVLPWLIFYLIKSRIYQKIKNKKELIWWGKMILAGFLSLSIGLTIFFVTWPYLWPDPLARLGNVFSFYKGIGQGTMGDTRFLFSPLKLNIYPLFWILVTTPLIVLMLFVIGILGSLVNLKKDKNGFGIFLLLWFLVPVLRVTLPKTNVYGGIRQIMEYIPGMAILAGIGSYYLINFLKKIKLKTLGLIALSAFFFVFILKLAEIHPYENAYFNELIGGLPGARNVHIPYWGNTFGGAYREAVSWINKNVEKGAKVTMARELLPNIPIIWFRNDILFHNMFRSGYLKEGEYIVGLTYYETASYSYFDQYLEKTLIPVFEAKADNVAVLKVWKNDPQHTKDDFKKEVKSVLKTTKQKGALVFDFGEPKRLSRIEFSFRETKCSKLNYSYMEISPDNLIWTRLPGVMPNEDWSVPRLGIQPLKGKVILPFTGQNARYVKLNISPEDSCLMNILNFSGFVFK